MPKFLMSNAPATEYFLMNSQAAKQDEWLKQYPNSFDFSPCANISVDLRKPGTSSKIFFTRGCVFARPIV